MIRIWIWIALFSGIVPGAKAQNFKIMEHNNQDASAIANALEEDYFKGIYEGDIDKLNHILHPGALLFGDIKGEPYAKNLEAYLTGVKNRVSPKHSGKPFKGTITAIEVINSIAMAKVQVKMYDFHYDEFLSFHKINNQWFIVNKMMTDISN